MPCLFRYRWLKLPRAALPQGKGLSAYWARLASRDAFRKGVASYCGHENPVEPGMWSGGVVGLKSILGVKKRERALEILEQLSSHGYLSYELNPETKQLTYRITDWEMDHCGSECESGNVYTTPGYGFLCVPRRITERLLSIQYYKYEESDAFLDLWCHTVSMDPRNAFSFFCSGLSIRQIRSFSDFGESGTALGLGEDQGMEVPAKARGRLRSMPAPRLLWLSHFQYALSLRYRGLSSDRRANSKRTRSCTGFLPACCQTWVTA